MANGQLHAPTALPPGKEPSVPFGWVGPRAGPDAVEKRDIVFPCRESNHTFSQEVEALVNNK
jgi:hypothetical protein